jgi:hypothetical protein
MRYSGESLVELDEVVESMGSADSKISSAFIGEPVRNKEAPLIYDALTAHTFVHAADALPVPSSCANSCSMLAGRLEHAKAGSELTQYIHPKHTCAWNSSSTKVFSFSIASDKGPTRWPRPDVLKVIEVDGRSLNACVTACSCSAASVRP